MGGGRGAAETGRSGGSGCGQLGFEEATVTCQCLGHRQRWQRRGPPSVGTCPLLRPSTAPGALARRRGRALSLSFLSSPSFPCLCNPGTLTVSPPLQNYEHLFKVNDKSVGGSFYLQSKVSAETGAGRGAASHWASLISRQFRAWQEKGPWGAGSPLNCQSLRAASSMWPSQWGCVGLGPVSPWTVVPPAAEALKGQDC